MRALALALALTAPAAAAQSPAPQATAPVPPGYDADLLGACLSVRQGQAERAGCIGLPAARCTAMLTAAPPEDFAACARAEAGEWQARLDESLRLLGEAATTTDAAAGTRRRDRLDAAQAAWAAWRAAECGWMRANAEGGGGEAVAEATCALTLTAERALALEQQVQRGIGP